MCSLRFENNLLSSEDVRFASISKKTLLSKLSFAFVSLALPLLLVITWYTSNAEKVGGADLKGVEHLCRIVRIYHCNLNNERIFEF